MTSQISGVTSQHEVACDLYLAGTGQPLHQGGMTVTVQASEVPPTSADTLQAALPASVYGEFLVPDFDAREYAGRAIEAANVSTLLARLKEGVDRLDRSLDSVVSSHQETLLTHASSLTHVEELLASVQSGHNALQVLLQRLRERINEPHDRVASLLCAAENQQAVVDLLRRLHHFQFLARRLQSHLQPDAVELPKAAACLRSLSTRNH